MAANIVKPKKAVSKTAQSHKFIIDYSKPADDKIFDGAAFEAYLINHLKVDGKTGQLGDSIVISKEGPGQLAVTSTIPFSKRYLKYLTKKFLKKNLMREWLRVVSTSKNTYTLKFFNVNFDEAADE